MMYETNFLHAIHYAEVCMAYGLSKYAQNAENKALMDKLLERYESVKEDSIAWQHHHVDGNVYGILPLQFYQHTQDQVFLKHGLFMADSQWENPLPNGMTQQTRYWIDDVFMVSSLQVEAFKATNDKKYLNRAALFTANYIDSLQQPNGLFHHGPEAPIYWGRGNGWMAVGMATIISTLPKNDPYYNTIIEGYQKMMKTLLEYQDENGMWRQIIDYPAAWEESSCTAMFAYAIAEGVRTGILKESQYKNAILKAWEALKTKVNEQGAVTDVCAGTGQSKDIQYYLDRPRINGDFHGQAPMVWLIDTMKKL
ncbi:MAG: glycoside hydrolase family 88 protein [Saprospiraceae bacterium]|nr:glycoside hydrolase family 88 protein [Saprospiraceae bacterium]